MVKTFLSYLLCLFDLKWLAKAVNESESTDELDRNVIKKAGVFK